MKQVFPIVLGLAVASPALSGQEWARAKVDKSPRHQEWTIVKAGDRAVQTYIVYPESKDKRPVVLLIHEIFGLTDWMQDLADQVAEAGYVAVVPDLLSGKGPNGGRTSSLTQDKAIEAIRDLPPDEITAALNAVADYGLSLPAATKSLFVAGFCWGGTQTFRFATNRASLQGAFVFYGTPPAKDDMARIKAPVFGFYAGNDARVDATIADAQEQMKSVGKSYEPVTYEGAGHGFMRAGEAPDASEANRKARDEAWTRWRELLQKGR
jgi:carboxymethylenebutenolidase